MSTNLEVGIVGLPNVGKSTLFNAITKAGAEAANYPFCTIEPNVGVVDVPDARLQVLATMYASKKIIPAAMRFVDIAGLVAGASKGEGLGNKFLSHIRQVDAIAQVIRCFDDPNITHVAGSIDPLRDIEIINIELCLADLDTVEKRKQRIEKIAKSGDKNARAEMPVLERVIDNLTNSTPVRAIGLTEEELDMLKELNLLTAKPSLFVANVAEDEVADYSQNDYVKRVQDYAAKEGSTCVVVSARIEAEIAELSDEEAAMFLEEIGLTESGLDKLIKASYSLLGLINYFTAGPQETHAWTIVKGTKAPQAAGKIHSDIEKGFIRAEIVSFDELAACGSEKVAKEKGLARLEGKEYIMQDGDVTYFRFNV
ncbi:GTP-binding protein [Veillonella montpellierensis DNF00314]|uniref:Ribosome-binding ATPase YchF n=1 Tax=Veillonella montpellierensis DNF00314 TaxID=1401067 RepID=A0A096BVW4_9FIRM|nr:redox-regulated ATPase YchF [Veillonella montpellierensis]KGF46862.1 GTP-binding protein [Veillonella montpellierensis DNF00314]